MNLTDSLAGTTNININGSNNNVYNSDIYVLSVSGNKLVLQNYAINSLTNGAHEEALEAIVNSSTASGALAAMKNYVNGSTSSYAKSEAVKSAEAQVDNSGNRIAFNNINTVGSLVSNRLDTLRSGISSGEGMKNKAMWAQAMGSSVKQGNTSIDGYDAKTTGLAFGFDNQVDDNLILGVSGAYSHSSVNGRNSSKDTFIDNYQLSFYSGFETKDFFLNGVVGFGWNEYKSSRYISVASAEARANYSGQSYSARAEIGQNYKMQNDVIFTPTLTLTAAKNSVDSYDESGAGTLNLHVRNDSANFFETRAGAQVKKFYKTKSGEKFAPQFSVSYGYDFAGNRQKATSNFIGQNLNFTNSGARIAQGSLKIGTGIEFFARNDLSLSANYIFENRNQYSAHSGWLKARYNF